MCVSKQRNQTDTKSEDRVDQILFNICLFCVVFDIRQTKCTFTVIQFDCANYDISVNLLGLLL